MPRKKSKTFNDRYKASDGTIRGGTPNSGITLGLMIVNFHFNLTLIGELIR